MFRYDETALARLKRCEGRIPAHRDGAEPQTAGKTRLKVATTAGYGMNYVQKQKQIDSKYTSRPGIRQRRRENVRF